MNKKKKMIAAALTAAVLLGVGCAATFPAPQAKETKDSTGTAETTKKVAKATSDSSGSAKDDTETLNNPETKSSESKTDTGETNSEKSGTNSSSARSATENKSSTSSSDKSSSSSPTANSSVAASADKNNSSSTTSSKPATDSSSSSTASKPAHTHNWEEQFRTVHHPEVGHNEQYLIKAAWTEQVPIYGMDERTYCSSCHADISDLGQSGIGDHVKQHMLAGENGGYYSKWVQVVVGYETISHPAEYGTRWVVDQAAYDERVSTGFKCSSCGATK
ncbi:hypothetical protein [Faecalibaculum rodentium]|uniref:Uncharacterized protein n=1 Tax=Faecalibaculum rodentium TaxID=1702221 RepID=A0A140DT03_9FIRM|nr:hypothetical protein [Faecalibaculum rodentium]AMK53780.1 hypothetical protein AALO17_06460 [Faecalibaculum rodentium]